MEFCVESLLVGSIQPLTDTEASAIAKQPVTDSRHVTFLGIEGDHQADLSVHGGPDKAIHHYPHDHYAFWQASPDASPILTAAGAFGENISTTGLTETLACIGDRYRLGTALVEIAQGRQPCWKQAHRLGDTRAVATMVKAGRCGWYYRVIEEGQVKAGDMLALLDRPHVQWAVARVIDLLVAGSGKHNVAAVRALSAVDVLATGWRRRAAKMAGL